MGYANTDINISIYMTDATSVGQPTIFFFLMNLRGLRMHTKTGSRAFEFRIVSLYVRVRVCIIIIVLLSKRSNVPKVVQ